jgi:hypothetical protein
VIESLDQSITLGMVCSGIELLNRKQLINGFGQLGQEWGATITQESAGTAVARNDLLDKEACDRFAVLIRNSKGFRPFRQSINEDHDEFVSISGGGLQWTKNINDPFAAGLT